MSEENSLEQRLPGKILASIRIGCWVGITLALFAGSTAIAKPAAPSNNCPGHPDALGTARVLEVDAVSFPQIGLKNFPQTLPLRDHEVVLTFDDGPWPPTTPKVLAALAKECVRATFFLIGKPAYEHPTMVRRIAAEGHSIGSHTWTHFDLSHMSQDDAFHEIDDGIAAVEQALYGIATTTPTTPFFRFPDFLTTPATLDLLRSRGIVVFGADLWANDWDHLTPKAEFRLLTWRLRVARKGIILLHDSQPSTAAMLPAFLRYLRENHYRVVHVVPNREVHVAPRGVAFDTGHSSATSAFERR